MAQHSILGEIEAFIAQHGMAESTFGREALGDWKLIAELRRGRDLRLSTVDRIRAFIESHQQVAELEAAADQSEEA